MAGRPGIKSPCEIIDDSGIVARNIRGIMLRHIYKAAQQKVSENNHTK